MPVGLDAGPMGGVDTVGLDREFFEGTSLRSFMVVNIGHAAAGASSRAIPSPRAPRGRHHALTRSVEAAVTLSGWMLSPKSRPERRLLADLVDELSPSRRRRGACGAWTVHDVTAHLLMPPGDVDAQIRARRTQRHELRPGECGLDRRCGETQLRRDRRGTAIEGGSSLHSPGSGRRPR